MGKTTTEKPDYLCECGGLLKRTTTTIITPGRFHDLTIWECMLCHKIEIEEN